MEMIGRIGGIRAMDGRFVSKCIEQWGIASGGDRAIGCRGASSSGRDTRKGVQRDLSTHPFI